MSRTYTIYNGYRIYLPLKEDFKQDSLGSFLVHAHLSDADGSEEKVVPIPGCIADSINQAWELSLRQAIRMIDEGNVELSATGMTARPKHSHAE